MFAWWGRVVVRFRWAAIAAALALVVAGATWGAGVFGAMTGGGFEDPASESTRAHGRIAQELGSQDADLLVLYSSDSATVDDPAFRRSVTDTLAALRRRPDVANVLSYYDAGAAGLVSADRRATYAVIQLRVTGEDAKTEVYQRLAPALRAPGLTTEVGGNIAFLQQANEQTKKDISRAERLSMPVLLVLLVIVFGGLVAAAIPLLIGVLAILGAFVATRLLTAVTDVSLFAINIITLIGLGMAIDYSLFVVSRFREELAAGQDTSRAIARTMATAGRTVVVSGLTITLALASLLIFPQVFLRSMGLGGMAAVLVAMLASLTVLPAVLAVLGPRVNALRVRLPWRPRQAAPAPAVSAAPRGTGSGPAPGAPAGAWARIARSVMRRPVRYVVGVVAVLLVLAAPFLRIQWGGFDERVLPADRSVRVVAERIRADFPAGSVAPIEVLVSGAPAAQAQQFAEQVGRLPQVTGARVTANRGQSTVIEVSYAGEPTGAVAAAAVRAIRDLPPPSGAAAGTGPGGGRDGGAVTRSPAGGGGAEVLVGGRTAADIDLLHSLGGRLPWMALIMASSTLVLLFLAFGSLLLPVKAVLMNLVSIGASFGVVVWVFQDGHLAGPLGFTSTGFIEPTNPILMLAVLFGLATDYEVFLLSRIREEWDHSVELGVGQAGEFSAEFARRTGGSGGDNTAAVSAGLQHTGRIITAAALLLMVVVAGFATGGITFIKLIGVGMLVALLVDATLVRVLLVPATMRLLGRWNWWAPGPLARVYRRYGGHNPSGGNPSGGSPDSSPGSVVSPQHRRVAMPAEQ